MKAATVEPPPGTEIEPPAKLLCLHQRVALPRAVIAHDDAGDAVVDEPARAAIHGEPRRPSTRVDDEARLAFAAVERRRQLPASPSDSVSGQPRRITPHPRPPPAPADGVEARAVEAPAASPQAEEELVLARRRRAPGCPRAEALDEALLVECRSDAQRVE